MQESIKKFELSGFIQSTLVQTRSRRWWVFWGTQTVWRFHEFNSDWQASNTNPVLDIYLALKKEVYSSTGIKIGSYKTPEFKEVNYILSSKKSI